MERVVDVECRFDWVGHLLVAYAGKPLTVVGLDIYQPYLKTVERDVNQVLRLLLVS